MDGTLTVENGSIYELFKVFARNLGQAPPHPAEKAALWERQLVRLAQLNPVAAARANAAYYYRPFGGVARSLPRYRPSIFLRLFRRRRQCPGERLGE